MDKKTSSHIPKGFVLGALVVALLFGMRWIRSERQAGPGIDWQPFTIEAFQQADRPVVIDMYADWCMPCVEMEHSTFKHPEVIALMPKVLPLRIDATDQENLPADIEAFMDDYGVFGLPTILFFNDQQEELKELRLLGFETGKGFAKRIASIL